MMKTNQKKAHWPENMENDQNENNSINEPIEIYNNPKTLHFFSSFADENEATAKLNANLAPVEHLKNAHKLIIAHYGEEIQHLVRPYYNITFVIKDGIPC